MLRTRSVKNWKESLRWGIISYRCALYRFGLVCPSKRWESVRAALCVRAAAHVFGISVTRRLLEGARECQSAEQHGSQTSGVMRNTPTPVWELELDCRGNRTALRTSHSFFPRLSLQFSVHLFFLGIHSGALLVQIFYWYDWVKYITYSHVSNFCL